MQAGCLLPAATVPSRPLGAIGDVSSRKNPYLYSCRLTCRARQHDTARVSFQIQHTGVRAAAAAPAAPAEAKRAGVGQTLQQQQQQQQQKSKNARTKATIVLMSILFTRMVHRADGADSWRFLCGTFWSWAGSGCTTADSAADTLPLLLARYFSFLITLLPASPVAW